MAGSVAKSIFKELQAINRKSLYDDTAVVEPIEEDNPVNLKVTLTPQSGYYRGGSFEFLLEVPDTYPNKPPKVTCKTKIYHPNISYVDGRVCLSMLSEPNSSYLIEHYINGLLFLFQHPNIESRLNGEVTADPQKFPLLVRDSLAGKRIRGMKFPAQLSFELTFNDRMETFLACLDPKSLAGIEFPLNLLCKFTETRLDLRQKLRTLLPAFELALAGSMEISFFLVPRSTPSVGPRSELLKVPQTQVIKEMVVLVEDKPHLFLTNGPDLIDEEAFSRALKKPVRVPKAKEAKAIINAPFSAFSAFSLENPLPVIYNRSIFDEGFVYTAAGLPFSQMKIRPADLEKLLPAEAQLVSGITSGPVSEKLMQKVAGELFGGLMPSDLVQVPIEIRVIETSMQALDISVN